MQYFCQHPWSSIDISPQGNLKPCCKYQNKIADNLADYLTSKEMISLRKEFLSGARPKGCERCWQDEDAGLPSKRIIDSADCSHPLTEIDTHEIQNISVAFGNTCNLACVTCDSSASSRWISESQKFTGTCTVPIHAHKKLYNESAWIEQLKDLSAKVKDLIFQGGEPFLNGVEQHLEYLDFLIATGHNDCKLTYITNCTTFPSEEFWTRWKNFKNVNIQMSIDGINDHFEYIRWPADWNKCYNNIKNYQAYKQKTANMQLSISHTVSIFNILYLPNFFIWCLKESLPEPYLGPVSQPLFYNVQCLPQRVKSQISDRIKIKKFSHILTYMNQQHRTGFDFFLQRTAQLDQIREVDFSKTFSELSDILKSHLVESAAQ